MHRVGSKFALLWRVMLVCTFVTAAFSHTAVTAHAQTPDGYDTRAFASQYTLPDGTLPVICQWFGHGEPFHSSPLPCEFCSIADKSSTHSPNAETAAIKWNSLHLGAQPFPATLVRQNLLRLSPPGRAPPLAAA